MGSLKLTIDTDKNCIYCDTYDSNNLWSKEMTATIKDKINAARNNKDHVVNEGYGTYSAYHFANIKLEEAISITVDGKVVAEVASLDGFKQFLNAYATNGGNINESIAAIDGEVLLG